MKLLSQRFSLLCMLLILAACDPASIPSDTGEALTIKVLSAPGSVEVGGSAVIEVQLQEGGRNIDGASYLWTDESASPISLGSYDNKAFFLAPGDLDQAKVRVTASIAGFSATRVIAIDITTPVGATGNVESLTITGPTDVTAGHKVILNAAYTVNGLVDTSKDITWSQFSGPTVSLLEVDNRVEFTVPNVDHDTDFFFSAQTEDADGVLFDTLWLMVAKPEGIAFVNQINTGDGQVGSGSQSSHTIKQVTSGQTAHLSALAQISGGGGTFTYQWTQVSGASVTLNNSTSQTANFVAPNQPGKLVFQVVATETGSGKSTSQTQVVEVIPAPFQPQQGVEHHVYNNHGPITLTAPVHGGTGPFTYKWTQTQGPHATISSLTTAPVDVTPPAVATDTDFQWVVQVTDANGHQVSITHDIKVKAAAPLTVSIIKPNGCITNCLVEEGDSVHPAATITGGLGSISVLWESTDVSLSDAATEKPSFVVPNVNSEKGIRVSVTVTDGTNTVSDSLLYTAKPVLKLVPHQNQIGSNLATGPGTSTAAPIQVESGKTFKPSIDVHAPPGATLTYKWTVVEPNPKPADLIIAGENTAQPIVNAPSVSTNTNIKLQAVITYTSATGKVISKTTETQFQAVPTNAPSKPALSISMAGHESVYSGHVVHPKVTVMNASGTLSYQWTQVSGPTVTISGDTTDSPSFTAPSVTGHQDIVIEVEVSDGSAVEKAQMTVAVDPVIAPPKLPLSVTASNDATVTANEVVKPRVSVGNTFGTLSYAWTETTSTGVTITDANTATPSFTAPGSASTVTLEVTVTDTANGSATDTVTYHVNNALQVTAGAPTRTLAEGNTLNLLASVKDADGAVTYSWTVIDDGGTSLSTANITDADKASASLDLPNVAADTNIKLQIRATDDVNTANAIVAVTIQDRHMTVDLGADFNMPPGQPAFLHANVSGGLPPYTFNWVKDDTNAALSSTSSANPSLTAPSISHAIDLEYSLEVTDAIGNKATDDITVTVNNPPFSVDAGESFPVLENTSVYLWAHTEFGVTPSFQWTQIQGSAVTINDPTSSNPNFLTPNVAAGSLTELKFEVEAVSNGVSAKDQVSVFVQSLPDIAARTNAITVQPGQTAKLTGTVLDKDPNNPGTVTTLEWKQITGQGPSVGPLTNASAQGNNRELTATFVAPDVKQETRLGFMFSAKGTGNWVQMPGFVTIKPASPTVDAGKDIRAWGGTKVQLSATGTNATTFAWSQTAGQTVTLSDTSSASPSFTAPIPASCDNAAVFPAPCVTLTFEVTATGSGGSSIDTVEVYLYQPEIKLETAQHNFVMTEGDTLKLDVNLLLTSGATLDNSLVNLDWSDDSQGKLSLSDSSTANVNTLTVTAVPGSEGSYEVTLVAQRTVDADAFKGSSLTIHLKVKKADTPPLMSDSDLAAALKKANTDLTALNGVDKLVSLHAPAITGGTPPYTYSWAPPAKGVTLSGEASDNPTATISKPASECTFTEGDITLTVTDAKGQSVSATLHVRNSRGGDAVNPTPTSPVSCDYCRGPKFICERSHKTGVCGTTAGNPENLPAAEHYKYQYCINDVENLIDGSRYVTRRCATAEKVNEEFNNRKSNPAWSSSFQSPGSSSGTAGCKPYNVHDLQDSHFSCVFACKGKVGGGFDGGTRGCNVETVPAQSGISIQIPDGDYPVPTTPATVPGTGSPGSCPSGIQPAP